MSEIKVNKISPRTACGTTTLGASGDTFTIPSGVTLSNLGPAAGLAGTGESSWDTTVKTNGTFTSTSRCFQIYARTNRPGHRSSAGPASHMATRAEGLLLPGPSAKHKHQKHKKSSEAAQHVPTTY